MDMIGAKIIWGIPTGIEPCKMYKCYFTSNDCMRIVDDENNASFTLFEASENKWECSLKTPIIWAQSIENYNTSSIQTIKE